MELDERDLSHLQYIATLYANQPWEVGAFLNVFRLGTGRSDDDPLMQVLIQIDKECEKPDSTILSVVNSLLESSCPNCKHAGEIFLTTLIGDADARQPMSNLLEVEQ